MVKLGPSAEQAAALDDPRIQPGQHGWTTIRFAASDAPDAAMLRGWVRESYTLLAPKALLKCVWGRTLQTARLGTDPANSQ